MDQPPTLGRILRGARHDAGVSQRQLAIRTGVAAPAISRIETGRESPSFERFAIFMGALGFEARYRAVRTVGQ
jgi:transcriptional regulator with XRE-family HTH domain